MPSNRQRTVAGAMLCVLYGSQKSVCANFESNDAEHFPASGFDNPETWDTIVALENLDPYREQWVYLHRLKPGLTRCAC
jgi:hypothetical protein